MEELKERLPRPLANLIVGQTGSREIGPWPRFAEIKNYIIKHKPHANWRALDDAIVDFPVNCPQLIRCDPNVGLTMKEITALSNWLGGDRPPTASLHRLNF